WRVLQSKHHREVRRQLKGHGGREVDTAGDGFFATFRSPAQGLRCAAGSGSGVTEPVSRAARGSTPGRPRGAGGTWPGAPGRPAATVGIVGMAVVTTLLATLAFVGRRDGTAPPAESILPLGLAALDQESGTIAVQQDYEGIAIALSSTPTTTQSFVFVSGGHV